MTLNMTQFYIARKLNKFLKYYDFLLVSPFFLLQSEQLYTIETHNKFVVFSKKTI